MNEKLDELARLHAEATPGPWIQSAHPDAESKGVVDLPSARSSDPYVAVCWRNAADAAAIVAEHNALPALVAALGAVLDRHHRIGEGEPGREIDYCDYDGFVWPCEEYRAVAAALGEA